MGRASLRSRLSKTIPCVAVVDDEESIRRALQRLLTSAGLAVETFASGEEFLQCNRLDTLTCVVLDLHMPRLNGFDVQSRLAQSNSDLPVLIITGHDNEAARERVLTAGARAYFRKPVDGRVLLEVIGEVVAEASTDTEPPRENSSP